MPLVSKTFSEIITFTRATSATYFDATGTLQSAGNNVARFDYDPSTLAPRGFLIEEQRTNSIRNNTMQGAVAGTPGTLPTNWSTFTSLTGLTRTIVGLGTENGITYIDIQISGTPSAAGTYAIYFETTTGIAAATTQTWSESAYLKVQAGTQTGISGIRLQNDETNAGVYVRTNSSPVLSISSAALNSQRLSFSVALSGGATVTAVQPYVQLTLTGVAIDITLRIGLPQMELGAFATSVIPTSTVAVTRNADAASVNTLSPWYNASAGTVYAEFNVSPATVTSSARCLVDINDGTTNNRYSLRGMAASTAADQFTVRSGGATQFQNSSANLTTTAIKKLAAAYAVNDFAVTSNGSVPVTAATGSLVSGVTVMNIGTVLGGEWLNGWLRRITYYPRRLTNAELQTLTT